MQKAGQQLEEGFDLLYHNEEFSFLIEKGAVFKGKMFIILQIMKAINYF